MKTRIATILSLAAIVAGTAFAKEAAEKESDKVDFAKIKCVISGKPTKEAAAADYNKAKVYFCCNNCVAKFKKDAKPFATKANHQLVATKQAKQTGCPMSGKKTAKGTEVEVAGVEVAFCCKNCKGAAEKKKGDEQVELIFNDKSFKKGFELAKAEKKDASTK